MRVLITIIIAAALAGCGATSDEDQVRDAALQLAEDGRAHRWGDFCAKTTDPDRCAKAIAGLRAMGVDAAQFIPSDKAAENMRITIDQGRAVVDTTEGEDAEYVRRGDRWLFVWKAS